MIHATPEEVRDDRLQSVLQRCREENMQLNKDNYVIKTQELKYLGHTISSEGVKADPAKVAAVVNRPVLKSKEDVC